MVNANSNFLDISVLEWCKLFGDRRGKHHWRKVVANQDAFLEALLIKLKITEQEFDAYIEEMRIYRDKFIAHLDTEKIMHPPKMRVARKSVSFLYDHLLSNEQQDDCFHDAPKKASKFYAILLTATLSVMLLAGSTDLIMLFVALETLSI